MNMAKIEKMAKLLKNEIEISDYCPKTSNKNIAINAICSFGDAIDDADIDSALRMLLSYVDAAGGWSVFDYIDID